MNIRNSNNEQIKSKITPNSNNNNSNMKTSSSFFPPPPSSTTTTTTTKTIFKKLSNSSTSSMTSNSSSTNSLASITNQQPLINPFEETNRFRLEQSVLSPNLFHVANTSTPERDTNSLWNIDQRAVLYPADIPIDESSLMAQYACDYKLSKQVIPAVEAFWTQNKIIIESPLTGTTGSALRAKFAPMFNNSNSSSSSTSNKKNRLGKANSVNSPLTNELYTNFSHKKQQQQQQFKTSTISSKQLNSVTKSTSSSSSSSSNTAQITTTYIPAKSKRDQTCQTNLTIPFNFDLSKIPELNKFLLNDIQINELSPFKKEELNNSIRKKLFDHNSEDSASTVTTTTTTTNNKTPVQKSALLIKLKSSDLSHLKQSSELKHISQLPKPEIYSSSSSSKSNHLNKLQQPRTLAASSSSSNNTDDCWHDSFEFDDHQFASSPKNEKYSNILHDIGGGGCGGDDEEELSDSVFHHRTPPDLSPLLDRSQTNHNHSNIIIINNNMNSPKIDYQFEPIHSASKLITNHKNEKCLNSPNLSPIRQQHESTNCTLKTSNNKLKNSQFNSSSSNSHAKSIIFMDIGGNISSNNNKSFSESITDNINSNETCRYSQESNENNNNNRKSLNDDTKLTTNNNNNNNNNDANNTSTKRISINKTKKNNTAGSTSSSNGSCSSSSSSSNKPAFLLLTSMMSETTTNTFNQDSQDTGYQTTSVVNGSNGSNTTSNINSNNNNNVNNPSIITMDMTQNNNELTNNCLFLSSTSTSLSTSNHKRLFHPSTSNNKLITNTLVTSSTPMNIEIEDEQLQNKENSIQTISKAVKRPSLDLNNKKNSNNNKTEKMKKNSVSLNSLENMKPIEASTPQMLKYSSFNYSNSKSSFKPVNKSTTTTTTTSLDQKKKVNFYKSKTISFEPTSQQILFNFYNNDVSMSSSTNTSNLMFSTDAVINDDLIIKKNEIDSIYVEQSILMNKISPSDYARTVLQKAKQDLKDSIKFTDQNS